MPAMALGDFLASPFGIVADVKMLNFFRYMGTVGMMVVLVLVALSVVVAEFLVPVSLPVWRTDGNCVGAEPGEDPARCGGVHRLREMQQGVPLATAGGQAGADPVSGVHGVHGVHCGVPGGECAADGVDAAEGERRPLRVGGDVC